MDGIRFSALYLLILGICVGGVEGARARTAGADTGAADEGGVTVTVAVPPKPTTETEIAEASDAAGGGAGGALYDEATCRRYAPDLRDVCFHALARQRARRDLPGALEACGTITLERLQQECQADAAELHVPASLQESLAVCPTISRKKWRDQCFFGVAVALSRDRPALALETCGQAGMWQDFCRHDVLGEVSTYDLDFVLDACGREQGDLLARKSCWHGIGKYIGRQDLPRAFAACQEVPPGPEGLYRQNCVHGVGWAAGERSGTADPALCEEAGPERDSCVMGLAFALKRRDTAAAIDLCGRVGATSLRGQCQDFLAR